MVLIRALERFLHTGTLTLIDWHGRRHTIAASPAPRAVIRLNDPRLSWRLLFQPELALGEAYMDGTASLPEGGLYDFLDLVMANAAQAPWPGLAAWRERWDRLARRWRQFNTQAKARRNIAHHYDLSGALYELFLDRDRQYSCAYFRDGDQDLDAAQEAKKRHITTKLLLRPGQSVLDIGSGWGGLALHLARAGAGSVEGLTLSSEQLAYARSRAERAGLAERVRFTLRDYRAQTGRFDRIVSVGMFEHVGIRQYDTYFARIRDLLAEDGVALLHAIGRSTPPCAADPWIDRYIFPGGYIPALSEVLAAIERQGLLVTDVEVLRLHYADTLNAWRQRFAANREAAKRLYDERFCRMWEYYLTVSELAFRRWGHYVFQIQMAKRQDVVPRTRDYLYGGRDGLIQAAQ